MTNKTKHNGFSFIEIVVVIGIMTALAAIAVPVYNSMIKRSKEAMATANINIIRNYTIAEMMDEVYSNENIFTYTDSSGSTDYISKHLENKWAVENTSGDAGDSINLINLVNPTSEKKGIINNSNLASLCSDDAYCNQALYITDSTNMAYDPDSPIEMSTDSYNGSLVIWYDQAIANNIYFYYIDVDGKQSTEFYVIENKG